MAKGTSKDKKPAEKKAGEKGKGKSEAADKGAKVRRTGKPFVISYFLTLGFINQGKAGLKAATAVNVRHILCEKHSKATEALQRIQVRCKMIYYHELFADTSCRPGSDSTKLPKNVRRTRRKVYDFTYLSSDLVLTKKHDSRWQLVVAWVGWFADPWWCALFSLMID